MDTIEARSGRRAIYKFVTTAPRLWPEVTKLRVIGSLPNDFTSRRIIIAAY